MAEAKEDELLMDVSVEANEPTKSNWADREPPEIVCQKLTAINDEIDSVQGIIDAIGVQKMCSPSAPEQEKKSLGTAFNWAEAKLKELEGELLTLTCTVPNCLKHNQNVNVKKRHSALTKEINPKRKTITDDGFIKPKQRHAGRGSFLSFSQPLPAKLTFTTKNPFQPIAPEVDNNEQNVTDDKSPAEVVDPELQKSTPIFMSSVANYNEILKILTDTFPELTIRLSGENFKITPKNIGQHRLVIKKLNEMKVDYYIITPRNERPLKVVIKGLHKNTPVKDIEDQLTKLGFSVEKVAQLKKFRTGEPLSFFQVVLHKNNKAMDIKNLKHLCYLSVIVENFNRKSGPTQCYTCNRFGHSSANCFSTPRCLKCGESHRTSQCLIKETIPDPKCINCGKIGHIASYRGCEAFPKPKKPTVPVPTQNHVRPNVSYALATAPRASPTVTKTPSAPTTQQATYAIAQAQEQIEYLDVLRNLIAMANDIFSLLGGLPNVIDLIAKVKNAQDPVDKLATLLGEVSIKLKSSTNNV